MKYTVKNLKDDKIEITFELTPAEWDEAVNEAYKKSKNKFEIDGFSKGKAPRKMIEKKYGDTVFYDDAVDGWFYKNYVEVLKKEKQIKPVDAPSIRIDKLDSAGLTLVATVENRPDVKLGEYKGITIAKTEPKVSQKELDDELNKIREGRAKFVEVKRPAKMGDFVIIDFEGSIDGKVFEGGTATKYELELGSKSFVDTFEEQIAGMEAGGKRDIKIKFPDNYPVENLKGKLTIFKIDLEAVKEKVLPEIDDAFAAEISQFKTAKEFKDDQKKKLLDAKKLEQEHEQEGKLLDKITANAAVKISETLINNQIDDYIYEFERRLKSQNLNLDDYLKYTNTTMEKLRESRKEDAKKTAKMKLVMEEIIVNEKIKVTDKDLEAKFGEFNKGSKNTAEEIRKLLGEEQFAYFESNMLMNKLLDFLKKNNTI